MYITTFIIYNKVVGQIPSNQGKWNEFTTKL